MNRKMLAAGLVLGALMLGGCTLDTTTVLPPEVDDPEVAEGLGSQDASGDVKVAGKVVDYGWLLVTVDVTNTSSKASDYWLTVAAESKSGARQYGTGNGYVSRLKPGQTISQEVGIEGAPESSVLKVVEVQRTASTS